MIICKFVPTYFFSVSPNTVSCRFFFLCLSGIWSVFWFSSAFLFFEAHDDVRDGDEKEKESESWIKFMSLMTREA